MKEVLSRKRATPMKRKHTRIYNIEFNEESVVFRLY